MSASNVRPLHFAKMFRQRWAEEIHHCLQAEAAPRSYVVCIIHFPAYMIIMARFFRRENLQAVLTPRSSRVGAVAILVTHTMHAVVLTASLRRAFYPLIGKKKTCNLTPRHATPERQTRASEPGISNPALVLTIIMHNALRIARF